MAATILGGGMGGLSAAYYVLKRFDMPATLYESSIRVGGWVRTEHLKDKKTQTDFRFEAGPRTLRPKGLAGANTLEMIEELELPIEGIPGYFAVARNRMIYAKGQLCMLPNSIGGIFRVLPPFTKPLFSSLLHDLRAESTKTKFGDESIYDFAKRRFGHEVAEYAISSMICGICAGDAKQISVRFLMDELYDKEQRYGGVAKGLFCSNVLGLDKQPSKMQQLKQFFNNDLPPLYKLAVSGKWSMYSVEQGMEAFPNTLASYLRAHEVDIQLSTECRQISFNKNGAIITLRDEEFNTRHVISALPSYKLAACVRDMHPSLAGQLDEIPYVDVAVVNLQFNGAQLLKQQAFGFLVPPVEQLPILGVIFDSCCFDMQGNTVLTVMMGGHWFEQYFGHDPSKKQLLDTAMEHVRKILCIEQEPEKSRVHILSKCIPQYTVGHKQRVANIRKYIKSYKLPLSLCGAAYDGVGINDVILSARRQVETLPDNYPDIC